MKKVITEEVLREIIRESINEYYLNENRFGKFGKGLVGAAAALGMMGSMQSCKQGYNEPDFHPQTEVSSNKEYVPHEYPVGDSMGQSAKAFKSFYDNCDWSRCGKGDGYVYSFSEQGCSYNSRTYWVNVAKKDKKDGYYSYLMYLPRDKQTGKIKEGDFIDADYLKNNCQLQAIFIVNCMTPDGEIETNIPGTDTNCPYSNTTKFYNQFNDWEIGMCRVYDKWISKDKVYRFQVMECIALDGKTYKMKNIDVDENTYRKYNKGDIL